MASFSKENIDLRTVYVDQFPSKKTLMKRAALLPSPPQDYPFTKRWLSLKSLPCTWMKYTPGLICLVEKST